MPPSFKDLSSNVALGDGSFAKVSKWAWTRRLCAQCSVMALQTLPSGMETAAVEGRSLTGIAYPDFLESLCQKNSPCLQGTGQLVDFEGWAVL